MKIYSEELKKIKLIDVFEIVISGEWGEENLKDNENTAYIIRTTNFLNNGTLDIENRELVKRQISSEKIDEKHLKRGDIIIEKSGGSPNQPVGRVVYFDIESEKNFLCNNFTSVLRVKEGIEPKYIFYFLKDCYKKRIVLKYQNKTTGIINLKLQDYLKNTEIQLPNIEIQKKIVAILDKAFLINSLLVEKERKILELNKSIFIEMFGDPIKNEKKWCMISLEKLCEEIGDGLHGTPLYDENGKYFFINGNNLNEGKININKNTKAIGVEEYKRLFIKLNKNTILISINGTLGKLAFYNDEEVILGKSVCYCNLKNEINKVFVYEVMNSNFFKEFLNSSSTKSTIKNVSLKTIRNFLLIVPPRELQNKFETKIKAIYKSKIEIQKSIEETQKLFDSLMEKYFG